MTALQLLRYQLKSARGVFDGTIADVTPDMLHKDPGGKALPLGAIYAHLVFSEDAILQGMVLKKTPLSESSFKDKTGLDKPMPPMDENWSTANEEWSHSMRLDLESFRKYAKAVFAQTDAYVDSLTDEDLDKEVDLGAWGKPTVATILADYIIGHIFSLTGEISVLKGIQGAKGYPF
jgi:hypothetical protein